MAYFCFIVYNMLSYPKPSW